MPDQKEPIPQFAKRIKDKYPEYRDIDDTTLAQKIVAKYPEYADVVDMSGVVKKKESSPSLSASASASSGTGEGGLVPLAGGDEAFLGFKERNKRYEEPSGVTIDENDPVGTAKKAIIRTVKKPRITAPSIVSSTAVQKPVDLKTATPVEQGVSFAEASKDMKAVENFFRNDTGRSLGVLKKATGLNDEELYSDEFDDQIKQSLQQGNATQRVAYETLQEAKKANKAISQGGTIEDMAVRLAGLNSPDIQEQIESQKQEQPLEGQMFGRATTGRFVFDAINNPAFQNEIKKNPELAKELRQETSNLASHNPDFGRAFYGNMISQEMEKMGVNNGILNVVTKDEFDKVVKSLKDKGEITLSEEAFINNNLRGDTGLKGLGKQIIGRESISTPGLVENAMQGFVTGAEDLGKGVAEVSGLRDAMQTEQQALRSDVEKMQTNVNVKPESTWHDITQVGGKMLGQSLSVGAGGGGLKALQIAKNPAVALGLSGGLQAFANYAPEARMLFPGDKLKQTGYATVMSGIEALTENIFRDDKVVKGLLKDFKPLVQNTIEDFTQKKISAAAAKASIENGVKKIISQVPEAATAFGKASGQNIAEEFAAGALGGITQGVFEGKPMSEWMDAEDLADTVKMAALGSPFMAALATRSDMMKNRGITSKQIYLMARDPEYWVEKLQETAKLDKDLESQLPDKLKNLEYASTLLKELDTQEGLTEKQKAKWLLTSLDSKIKQETPSDKTDPILRAKEESEKMKSIQENDAIKMSILNGDDDGTYEGDTSDELSKDEMKAVKILAKATLPDTYQAMAEQNPVGVLQDIAQQAQNLNQEGTPHNDGKEEESLKRAKETFGEDVVNEAINLYPAQQEPPTPMANQEGESNTSSPSPEMGDSGSSESGLPPTPVSSGAAVFVERPGTELSFRGLQNTANEFGYDDVKSRDRVSDIQERQNARETAKEWAEKGAYEKNVKGLLDKIEAREMVPTAKQRLILQQYLANKTQQLRDTPTGTQEYTDRLAEVHKIKQIGEIARQEAGSALRIPEGGQSHPVADFGDAIVAMADAVGTTELTEEQQKKVDGFVKEYEQKDKDAQAKIAELEAKLSEMEAAKEVKQSAKKKTGRKKTAQQYKDERAKFREELKAAKKEHEDWMKNKGIQSMGVSFSLTPKMVKAIGKIAGSYVEELGDNIAEITSRVLDEIRDFIPEATEKDVHDIISGGWDKEIERLEKNTERNKQAADEINKKTANKDFEKPPTKKSVFDNAELKKKFPELYKQALDALAAREDAKRDFDVALAKEELKKRSTGKKVFDIGKGVIATSKAIASGIDFSAIFMQNLVAMAAHPRSAAKALPMSFKDFASDKSFTRWLTELHNSPNWDLIEKSGLSITDPKSLREDGKEEAFSGNLLDKKFKIKGKTYQISKVMTKPFERQFTSLGNRMRVNMFLRAAERWQQKGITFESHPEKYKSLARMLNTETGRGGVPDNIKKSMENITPIIWSPKLIASRLNILGFSELAALTGKKGYYAGLDPEVRKMAVGDLVKFIGFGVAVMGAAAAMGGEVDDDPESSTFGTFKFGNKSYNVWGGFAPYVKTVWQAATGKKKTGDKEKKAVAGELAMKFLRGRLTPFAGTVTNLLMGKDYSGKPVTLGSTLESSFLPISVKGIKDGLEKDGVAGIITQGIPSIIGIGVADERDFTKKSTLTIYEKGKKRTATAEEEDKYNKLKDSIEEKKLASVIQKGIFIDKYGDITLDRDKKKKTVKYETLDAEQIKDLNGAISRQSAYQAKKELKWDK